MKIKLEQTEAELERHKTILADTETIASRNNKQLIADLEAAREEISVKVAQVKQYQRQVEMHKLQVTPQRMHIDSKLGTCRSYRCTVACMHTSFYACMKL